MPLNGPSSTQDFGWSERPAVVCGTQRCSIAELVIRHAPRPARRIPLHGLPASRSVWIATVRRFKPVNWAAVAAQKALLSPTPEWDVVLGRAGLLALFS